MQISMKHFWSQWFLDTSYSTWIVTEIPINPERHVIPISWIGEQRTRGIKPWLGRIWIQACSTKRPITFYFVTMNELIIHFSAMEESWLMLYTLYKKERRVGRGDGEGRRAKGEGESLWRLRKIFQGQITKSFICQAQAYTECPKLMLPWCTGHTMERVHHAAPRSSQSHGKDSPVWQIRKETGRQGGQEWGGVTYLEYHDH